MNDDVRARARAQHFGPEMLQVIGRAVARLDEEILEARNMKAAEIAGLLGNIREPLKAVHDRATVLDGED